jgi:hypothetical protein
VQYTRRDWRNRNQIKTPNGPAWITVPVEVKGRYFQAIDETRTAGPGWGEAHVATIRSAYARAAALPTVGPWLFEEIRAAAQEPMLSAVNERLLRGLCGRLGVTTPLRRCTDVLPRGELIAMDPTERLAALAGALGATRYLSGPAAKAYLDAAQFESRGIEVAWMSYEGYPDYPQLWGDFDPRLSVIDLLLNVGEEAPRYLTGRP